MDEPDPNETLRDVAEAILAELVSTEEASASEYGWPKGASSAISARETDWKTRIEQAALRETK